MKKNVILVTLLALVLSACGSGSSNAVSTALTTPTTPTTPTSSTEKAGKYTLTADGLLGKEVYAVISNKNLESSTTYKTTFTGISSSVSTSKKIDMSDPILKRIDIDWKFNIERPELTKSLKINKQKLSTSYNVGDERNFYRTVSANGTGSAVNYATTTAKLMVKNTGTRTINIWVDKSFESSVTNTQLKSLADAFYSNSNSSTNIYNCITSIYGSEWGNPGYSEVIPETDTIDILLTNLNTTYDVNVANGFTMGYFAPIDTMTSAFALSNYGSSYKTNERNMFYMDVNLFSKNLISASTETEAYYKNQIYSTLAHEFTHMICWYQKTILKGTVPSRWLNEMLAMISEDLMDDKIIIEGTSNLVNGSKARIPQFNEEYNSYAINDKDTSYDLENYAVDGIFGLYLTRAYGRSGLAFLNNIMSSTYTDYDAIEHATGATLGDMLKNFGKAVLLSSDSSGTNNTLYINKSSTVSHNSISYNLEAIDLFAYSDYPFAYLNDSIEGGANTYVKLKNSTGDSGSWTITTPVDNMSIQIVVKNADGTFDASTSATLNNKFVKN